MAKRHPIPRGVSTSAEATVTGVIQKQEPIRHAVLENTDVWRGILEHGQQDIPIMAFGKRAEQLSGIPEGSVVEVRGKLIFDKSFACVHVATVRTVAPRVEVWQQTSTPSSST